MKKNIVIAFAMAAGCVALLLAQQADINIKVVSGEKPARLLRADMTYAELPGGGAIFAVGSITFCGSLSHGGYDNNVSRILRNVLDRFRRPS